MMRRQRDGSARRSPSVWLTALGLCLVATLACSQQSREFRGDPAHYAFAVYLGSGLYRASGQDASVLTVPFSYTIPEGRAAGLKIRLPVAVGFFDFQFDDALEGQLPDRASTFSVHPGLEYAFRLNERWTLIPYGDIGWARNFSYDTDVFVSSLGVTAIRYFDSGDRDLQWLTKIYYARYDNQDTSDSDQFAAVQLALDRRFGRLRELLGQAFHTRLYVAGHWYFSPVDFIRPTREPATLSRAVEAGMSVEFTRPLRFWFFTIERLGLGVRYGENVAVWRLFTSRPF